MVWRAHSMIPHIGEVWEKVEAIIEVVLLCRAGLRQPQSALCPAREGEFRE